MTDVIESLRHQLAECERERNDAIRASMNDMNQLATVTRERDELVAYAKRYRWLRTPKRLSHKVMLLLSEPEIYIEHQWDELDAAIDAALAKLGADKGEK